MGYLTRRLMTFPLIMLGVSILVFVAIRLVPGDAITAMLGTNAGLLTPEQRQALATYFGIDQSWPVQYWHWLLGIFQGNLGISVTYGKPVLDIILERFPLTLELALLSMVIALATLPQTRGKFIRALALSAPGRNIMSADHADDVARHVLEELELARDPSAIASVPLPKLFAAVKRVGRRLADETDAGTVFGPVVGAFTIIGLENYLAVFGQWVTVVTGTIFVVCVLLFRRGIVGELAAWRDRRRRGGD